MSMCVIWAPAENCMLKNGKGIQYKVLRTYTLFMSVHRKALCLKFGHIFSVSMVLCKFHVLGSICLQEKKFFFPPLCAIPNQCNKVEWDDSGINTAKNC